MNDVNLKAEENFAEQPQQNRCQRCGAVFRSAEELARQKGFERASVTCCGGKERRALALRDDNEDSQTFAAFQI